MRINQFLAHSLGISRRQADTMIQKALVEVEGEIGENGQQVDDSTNVKVYRDGRWTEVTHKSSEENQTVVFYKPIFAITSKSDPEKRKTIYDYLPKIYRDLKPAGRLDYMSEGVLVMTTDGELIQELTHPSNNSVKEYMVGLKHSLAPSMIEQAKGRMQIDDIKLEPVKIEPASRLSMSELGYLKFERHLNWYLFTLNEGRNNQIRKMCASWGFKVHRLIRIKQGPYEINEKLYKTKIQTKF
jgi:23S rRNA pseudouridine2605 synthase